MKQHYTTLGLQEGASQDEIQAAYKRLSKELDPANNDNQEFFKEEYKKLQQAYKALSASSILATQGGAHKNILDQPTSSKKMDLPPQATNNSFTYLLRRKRNIITFIVLVLILKPVLHFSLFPETEQIINNDKKVFVQDAREIIQVYEFDGDTLVQVKKSRINRIWDYQGYYTKKGDVYFVRYLSGSNSLFYYPKEIRSLSFKTHIQQIFKVKLYLFLILILILSLIVFLFNDKIKAR